MSQHGISHLSIHSSPNLQIAIQPSEGKHQDRFAEEVMLNLKAEAILAKQIQKSAAGPVEQVRR